MLPASASAAVATSPVCSELFTQAEYRKYAKRVFLRETIKRPARERLERMRTCQHSRKARTNVRTYTKRLKRERWQRTHYWQWQRSLLSPAMKATLRRLRGCETRGIPYPQNYRWKGHHRGAYQYTFSTWARAGGSGDPADASPAEQDVRTAWFFPSHRSEWACSA
jgi:hypothetical protein